MTTKLSARAVRAGPGYRKNQVQIPQNLTNLIHNILKPQIYKYSIV